VPGVEEVAGGAYRRSLALEHGDGVVEVRADGTADFTLDDERDRPEAQRRLRELFDAGTDTAPIAAALCGDPLIGHLVRAEPDRRVPGAVDGDELAVRAILGQQVSLAGAATLAGRLVAAHGRRLALPVGAVTHVFPSAPVLAAADPSNWAMPRSRAAALQAVCAAGLPLHPGADRAAVRRALLGLPGVGPWTTEYVAMRALRDPDAFLPTDLGVRHALERLGQDPDEALVLAEPWRPYRAYALQHLWASLSG